MIKPIIVYSLYLAVFLSIVVNFQLNGLTDSGFYLEPIYNFYNFKTFSIAIYGGLENHLANHFSPFWILFSLLVPFLENPIQMINFIFIVAYLGILLMLHNLFFQKDFSYKNSFLLFALAILTPPLLFNFNLNYNGLHSVIFAPIFLIPSYYYLFIKEDPIKTIYWFLPLFLIKEEFWLLAVFVSFAIFVRFKELRFLVLSLVSLLLFYLLYYKVMGTLHSGDGAGVLSGHYSYLFESKDLSILFKEFLNLGYWDRRILFISLFFFPFLFIVDIKKIVIKDWISAVLIIGPTFGYCILSQQTPMTYWLFEHYSLPVLPVLIILVKKYGIFSQKRLALFFIINIILIGAVVSQKQPWQYKYYQDEEQLLEKIIPKLDIDFSDFLLADDRTGVYFTQYQTDYINFINKGKNKTKTAEYIIVNTRYSFSAHNLKYTRAGDKSSYDYLKKFSFTNYKKIYENYPFIVLEKEEGNTPEFHKEILDDWDKKTIESNRWF